MVFLTSAIGKLRRPKSFLLVVLEYQILPPPYARIYARLLPGMELTVGVCLLAGLIEGLASLAGAGLLAMFITGVGINLARGRQIECGCFGGGRQISWSLLLQDLVLLAAALVVLAQTGVATLVATWSALRGPAAPAGVWPLSLIGCLCVVVLAGRSLVVTKALSVVNKPSGLLYDSRGVLVTKALLDEDLLTEVIADVLNDNEPQRADSDEIVQVR